ncbi:ATP-binding protein [Alloprevotella tannerae]|jgi:Predicted ATPase|nr:AAA family ATPase [Alloprevotella tannerae]MCG2648520.1 ATP-binding protein [Alloprevotella tannerae]MCG2650513.1 ATP-binding protein [Alloprevotella tannerae]
MQSLKVKNFGPIGNVDVKFGDLTFLVGPQASGKSLFLELLKYIIDKEFVLSTLRKYNYIIDKKNPQKVFDIFFGDGMNKIFKSDIEITYNGEVVPPDSLLKRNVPKKELMFYIPAQRILSIADGRPKNFMEFDMATPYVLKSFSEALRIYIQGGMGDPDTLFPISNRLKSALKQSFDENIFHGGKIVMEENSGQKKMKMRIDGMSIPFMTWSAGQKEFMPLLIAFYCLSGPPSQVFKKDNYKYVVIEEPEMGLHPQAIESVLLEILELIHNGLKVIVSTHSTTLLDFAWAFNTIKNSSSVNKEDALYEMFDLRKNTATSQIFEGLLSKQLSTYYFSRSGKGKVLSTDISSLDVGSENSAISEWGGLSQFSSKVADIVYKYTD